MKTCADDFGAKGEAYRQARRILEAGCDYPPSLEVFEHEMEQRRETQIMTAPMCAAAIVSDYKRTLA